MPSTISGGGIQNPNSSNVTFSDPTRTFLLGDAAIYSDIGVSSSAGAQILIQSHATDTNRALAVVGAWRNGVSGERYYTEIWPDTHISTNSYISLDGNHSYNIVSAPASGYMLKIENDIPTGQLLAADYADSGGEPGRFVKAYGKKDGGSNGPVVWEQGAQGTLYLYNPYGQTGGVQYTSPQIVLGDIGTNYAVPSWTYSSIRQAAGHLRIGSFPSSTEGNELNISAGAVAVNGALSQSLNQNASTAITVTNTTSGASAESVFRAYSDSGRQTTIGTYSASTTGYGAIASSSSYIYSNAPQLVVMSDVGPIIFAANGNSEHVRIGSGLMVGTTTEPNAGNVSMSGKVTTYNNIATEGNGIGAIVKATRVTAQSAANASIATYTTPAADGSYLVSGNINVTAAVAISTSLNVNYTDETNTARTMIIPISGLGGTFLAGGLATSTGPFESSVMHIRTKASTAITIYTAAGTFTSATYNAEGVIRQLA